MLETRALATTLLVLIGCTTTYSDENRPLEPDACPDSLEPARGELGVLRFAHDRGAIACTFGCGLGEPLAEGSVSRIAVYADEELPPVSVTSDNPDVATFDVAEGGIEVTAGVPGSARLEVRNEGGEVIDAVAITVKPVASIETRDDLAVMIDGSAYVEVDLKDELGCPVLGIGGVTYAFSSGISEQEATLEDALADFLFGFLVGATDEGFHLDAVAVGSGAIRITAQSGAAAELPVDVVDASSITSVSLSPFSSPMQIDNSQPVTASAMMSGSRRVESPACTWAFTPTSGAPEITSELRDVLYVQAPDAASATVSCTIGSAASEIEITWAP
jgi:hypothetical protein